MQQRRLRLGDILDDYCPRERRITNHAIVAIVGEEVKQTRCTTCDADHEYKQAKVPTARRKRLDGGLPGDAGDGVLLRPRPAGEESDDVMEQDEQIESGEPIAGEVAFEDAALAAGGGQPEAEAVPAGDQDAQPGAAGGEDDGPVHRRLIRATLPRPEGQAPEFKEPEFTIRQPGGRGRPGGRRPHGGGGSGGGQGQRFGQGGPPRHGSGGQRHGSGQGQGQGQGQGRSQGNRAGGHGQGGNRGGGRPGQGQGGQGSGQGQNRGGGRRRGRG